MESKKYCIFGSSGFAKEVYWILVDNGLISEIDAFLVDCIENQEETIYNIPVKLESYFDPSIHFAVVAIGDVNIREKICTKLIKINAEFPNVIHNSVIINQSIIIGYGNIICKGTILTCDINLGNFNILNLSVTIGHDCIISNFNTINPSANISGSCFLDSNILIGTNSSLRQNISISSNVIVGMGAVVTKSLNNPGTYFGNPAKQIK